MTKLNSKKLLLSMASAAAIFVGGINTSSAGSNVGNTLTGAVTAGTADLALTENHALCAFGGAGLLTAHPNITLPKGKFSFIAGANTLSSDAASTFAPVDGSDISFVGASTINFGAGFWTQPTSGAVTYQLRGSGAVTLPDTALADAVTGFELFINAYTATTLTRASAGTLHATMNIIGNLTVGAEITALGGRLLGTGVLTLDATTVAVNCAYDKSFAGRIVTGAATVFESLPEKGMLSIQTGGFTVNSASKLGTLEVLSGTPTINATKSLTIKLLDLTDVAGATTIALGSSDANVIIEQIAPGSTGSLVITGTGSKAKLTVLKGALAAGITYSGFSGTVKLPA